MHPQSTLTLYLPLLMVIGSTWGNRTITRSIRPNIWWNIWSIWDLMRITRRNSSTTFLDERTSTMRTQLFFNCRQFTSTSLHYLCNGSRTNLLHHNHLLMTRPKASQEFFFLYLLLALYFIILCALRTMLWLSIGWGGNSSYL